MDALTTFDLVYFVAIIVFSFSMRGSAGFGLRYLSPIGAIRVDLGFKMDRREVRGVLERPTALHFSLGQAF